MAERYIRQVSFNSQDEIDALEKIAAELKFVRGQSVNVSGLIQAIAQQKIPLFPSSAPWSETRQKSLVQAILALRDRGEVAATKQVAALLLECPELLPEFRSQIDSSFSPLLSPWVEKLEELMEFQLPFQLSYQDAAGRLWSYIIRYAEFAFREKRNYLEIWSEETEGNQDLPELQHNWSLRLDRIVDAGVVSIQGEWRSKLDTVEVEFDLLGGLAHAYQQRDNDIAVRWIGADPPTKRVTRRISNTFWFIREVLRYGKDCVVLEPEAVRQKIREQLQAACDRYVTRRDEH